MKSAHFDSSSITLTAGAQCKQNKGFTLVELLVVITIIAILSVIGLTIFTGVQKSARDAKRRGDIDAIAKAMEVHFGETKVSEYAPLKNSHFASGSIPKDPKSGQSTCGVSGNKECKYCDRSEGSPDYCIGNDEVGDSSKLNTVSCGSDYPAGSAYNFWYHGNWCSWPRFRVCTNLESGNPDYYCKSNQQ